MTLAPTRRDRSVRAAPRRQVFRTDIQALRAIAIAAVVLNHLWPTRFGGGYVGVDVFFVISGYLITSHLFREISTQGSVRLGAFYARRIRRLLPAALLVLAASAVLVVVFLPYPRWPRNAAEILSSTVYVENWFLAAQAVNYSALNDAATVAQHYWSLSVEEQFYILWPLVIVAGGELLARTLRRVPLRVVLLGVVVVVGATSFVMSVLYTVSSPSQAYFATFTRAWEFAVGGAIALAAPRLRLARPWADAVAALGLVAIVFAVFTYGSDTSFPGSAASIPVVGTAAIIIAGTGQPRLWHTPISASRPVQWLGNVSYSLYLVHWPLIVIAPFALRSELTGPTRVLILVCALLLAAILKTLVEDRGQRWQYWAGSVKRAFVLMLAGMVALAVIAGMIFGAAAYRALADSPTGPLPAGPCAGPRALHDPAQCEDAFGPADSVVMAAKNEYFYTPDECGEMLDMLSAGDKKTTRVCDFSGGAPSAEVWLIGDSHAQQWQGAVFDLARERQWRVTTSYYGGCPIADVAFLGYQVLWGMADVGQCRDWSREASAAVAGAAPDIVFTSMAARHHVVDDGTGRSGTDQFVDGLRRDWQRWTSAGSRVVVLGDPPFNAGVRDEDCVLLNPDDPLRCARPRAVAQPPDPLIVAADPQAVPGVTAIDFTDDFCDAENCYAVVGRVPVYFDADHLNLQYVRLLAPVVAAALDEPPSGARS